MDEFGYEDEAYSLRLRVRQDLAQSLKRCGVRMPDRDGLALFASAAQRQLQLLAHGRDLRDIIEERNVSKGGANPEALCGIKSYCRRCSPAIHIEEMPVAQDRHEFIHERGIGSGLRTLMIIDAYRAGDIL